MRNTSYHGNIDRGNQMNNELRVVIREFFVQNEMSTVLGIFDGFF